MVLSHQQVSCLWLCLVLQRIQLCFYYPLSFVIVCSGYGQMFEDGSLGG
jgi:hypothetical protein